MAVLINRAAINLTTQGATQRSATFAIPLSTRTLRVRIGRRTTATPTIWPDDTGRLRITMSLVLDGVVTHTVSGQCSGGIRESVDGTEIAEYRLVYHPTVRRVGDEGRCVIADAATAVVDVEVELLRGNVSTQITLEALDTLA